MNKETLKEIERFKNKLISELEFLISFYETSIDHDSFQDQIVGIEESIGVVEGEFIKLQEENKYVL